MSELFHLKCPTCGAQLSVTGESTHFTCQSCGNRYLFNRKFGELSGDELQRVQPTVTYTTQSRQWLRVAEYEIILHTLSEMTVNKQRVLYIEVGYHNNSAEPIKCRHDQWVLFDCDGYTYEAEKDYNKPELYEGQAKRYLGLTRLLTPTMKLRGWLAYAIPADANIDYLQFAAGEPIKSAEFRVAPQRA